MAGCSGPTLDGRSLQARRLASAVGSVGLWKRRHLEQLCPRDVPGSWQGAKRELSGYAFSVAGSKPRTLLGGIAYPEPRDPTVSKTMSRIRSRDTSIELQLRRALWSAGLRYRLHASDLPGKPDIVFRKAKVAVFCDSSFWHGRDWTRRRERIRSNPEYWEAKISRNMDRDRAVNDRLQRLGWTVLRFWDSEIMGDIESCVTTVVAELRQKRTNSISPERGQASEAL